MNNPVDTIEFLSDGNALVRRGDGTEHLIASDDVPEFLLAERRKERERLAAASVCGHCGWEGDLALVTVDPQGFRRCPECGERNG